MDSPNGNNSGFVQPAVSPDGTMLVWGHLENFFDTWRIYGTRIGKFGKINAVLTFREWLDDFASDETRRLGDALIEKELAGIKEWLPKFYPTVMKQYEATCRGERDLFF